MPYTANLFGSVNHMIEAGKRGFFVVVFLQEKKRTSWQVMKNLSWKSMSIVLINVIAARACCRVYLVANKV